MNGGTTGGSGGTITRVATLDALKSTAAGNSKAIVIISGTITGNCVVLIRVSLGRTKMFVRLSLVCRLLVVLLMEEGDRIGWDLVEVFEAAV